LRDLYAQIAEDTKKKQRQAEKLNEYHSLKPKRGQTKGNTASHNHSNDSDNSMHSHGDHHESRKYGQLRFDLTKIAEKLRVVDDIETFKLIT
jgi:hypothetical protein